MMDAAAPFAPFHHCVEIPESEPYDHGPGDHQINVATDVARAIVNFTHRTGVVPRIEMVEESVMAWAKGVQVRIVNNDDFDIPMNVRHLADGLIRCLDTLEAEIGHQGTRQDDQA